MTAYDHAVTQLADLVKQAAHWGSTHSTPVDAYVEREAATVLDAILAAVDEASRDETRK